jgi:hypothetical protein
MTLVSNATLYSMYLWSRSIGRHAHDSAIVDVASQVGMSAPDALWCINAHLAKLGRSALD